MTALIDIAQPLRAWLADSRTRDSALLSKGYQGSVYLFTHAGQRWVVKRAGQGWLTGWLHQRMLRREAEVYQRLADIDGVPASLGLLDGQWLVLEFVDGDSLKQARFTLRDPDNFYQRLHAVIQDIHAAGVVHGDLKRKDNILVTADERPFVIDFGTALRRNGSFLDRCLYNTVARADFNAWIKVKYANDYSQISTDDARWYQPGFVESVLRVVRNAWRTISFRQTRKRWRRNRKQNRNS
jgi:predicted Ser/Thr protein kinase